MNRQSGVAMILVLMVSGILGLLMLQVSLTASEHLSRAQQLTDRVTAELAAQSREAAMHYSLLTEPWRPQVRSESAYAAVWNFHGTPFTVDGATWRLQDESGLLPVPRDRADRFVGLVRQLGVEPTRAERLGRQLMQLQSDSGWGPAAVGGTRPAFPAGQASEPTSDGRFPLQSLAEMRFLPEMDEALLARLESLLTLYPTPGFNPLTAPRELLLLRLAPSQVESLLTLRERNALDADVLWRLTGIEADDFTTVLVGPAIRMELDIQHSGVRVRRESTVILRPYAAEPFGTWSRREQRGAEG